MAFAPRAWLSTFRKFHLVMMQKNNRLQIIRDRAKVRLPLSEQGAATLEELRKEDPDLGGEAFGEILPPDNVKREKPPRTEDESEANTEEISPLMRAAMEG